MSKNILVRVVLPNKSIKFIEARQDETFGEISDYIKRVFDLTPNTIFDPITTDTVTDSTLISKIETKSKVLHIDLKDVYNEKRRSGFPSRTNSSNNSIKADAV